MQMYLWNPAPGGIDTILTVNTPSGIAGGVYAVSAIFGPGVPISALTADVVIVDDGTNPNPVDACETPINGAAISGKIALIDRGNCTFVSKVETAQNAGAVGVIVVNDVAGPIISMGGASGTITIPSVMISQQMGIL